MSALPEKTASGNITGIFLRELKNRFLCEVQVDGKVAVCYVPSSCHLANFLQLQGKEVLLTANQGKDTKTKYALYACPYKRNYILLSPAIANKAVVNSVSSRRFAFLGRRKIIQSEKIIDGYKADIYIQDTDTLLEIKAVISLREEAEFPTVFSERTLKQLSLLQTRLSQGKKACLSIISLNPYTKCIRINENSEFSSTLLECVKAGLKLKAFSCRLSTDQKPFIYRTLPIIWNQIE